MRSSFGVALAVVVTAATAAPGMAAAECRPPADQLTTQSRTVRGFHEIDLRGAAHVIVKRGARESMTVRADRRVLPYLETRVRGGRLEIDERDAPGAYRDRDCMHDTVIEVTAVNLSALSLSGAGSIVMASWSGKRLAIDLRGAGSLDMQRLALADLDVNIQGAGSLTAAGQVERQKVAMPGAGTYSAERLASKDAVVSISGTGNARVWASKTLDVTISGVGSVEYAGSPRLRRTISGMGKVAQVRR